MSPSEATLDLAVLDGAKAAVRAFVSGGEIDVASAAAFGVGVTGAAVAGVLQDFERNGWPRVILLDEDDLHGARGAYDRASDTIYLSTAFVSASPADVTAVLVEEIGHAIDARVNSVDAPGDEGAIFSDFVMGNAPSPTELAALKVENDHGTINVNGSAVAVEFAAPVVGSITLDGSLLDWTAADVIDKTGSVANYDVYGKETGSSFVFALKAPVAIGANTTVWFNTDQNAATGFKIFGTAGGAEYNINFDATGTPHLFTGDAGQTPVPGATVSFGYSANHTVVEFAVSTAAVGSPYAINTLWDVNNGTFLPTNFAGAQYSVVNTEGLPARTDFSKHIGIVYSDTSAAKYFSPMAYSQLFMDAQNQATMAGVSYDILTESDLTNLAKLANYDALVFTGFQNVQSSQVTAIENTLTLLVNQYHVGLIAAGNFMTNDQAGAALPGDSYSRMKTLLDVQSVASGTATTLTINAGDITNPMMADYSTNELIHTYTSAGWQAFAPVTTPGTDVLVTQKAGSTTYNSVITTTSATGSHNVHFSSDAVMADNNLLWQAIDYAVNPAGVSAALQLSRQTSIFAARQDMDQAMEQLDVSPDTGGPGIYDKLIPILQQWKTAYNFVGSYYVDIGNNPSLDQSTTWAKSGVYYKQMLDMGNELGSHSISHPEDTNVLTAAQIQAEFQGSRQIIEQQMSQFLGHPFTIDGAAVPGAPETLATALAISQYYNYISGGFSSVGAGYPDAVGYLTPAMGSLDKIYLAPNIKSDFSLVEFQHLTDAQASAEWTAEVAALSKHAEVPVLVWAVHDYAEAAWATNPPTPSPYTTAMFTNFIAAEYAAGAEFVTLDDLAQRIRDFDDSGVNWSVSGSIVTATVNSPDAGKFALDLDNLGTQKIASVNNWYAYDNDSVFLPRNGGTYAITLGSTQTDVTHITALPMRAELLSLTGNGTNLSFSLFGEGDVVIDVKSPGINMAYAVTGATVQSLVGEILTLDLGAIGQHDVSITLGTAANRAPTITSNGGGATAAITLSENTIAVTTVTATDPDSGQTLTYSKAGGVDAPLFAVDPQTGALAFKVAPDFEQPADQGANNVYDVIVKVTDSAGAIDTQAIAITVTNVAGSTLTGNNNANTLTGTGEEDTISGLGAADTLTGGAGNDLIIGGAGNDSLNGGLGIDTAQFSGLRSAYTITKSGLNFTVTGPDGTDTLTGFERLQFSDALIKVGGNSQIDANADGKSDVLWRNTDGTVAFWTMNGSSPTYNSLAANVAPSWVIIDGHGDYNGDGKSDILWQNTDGTVALWTMNGSSYAYSTLATNVAASWSIIDGHADYNGDGKSDILWQNTNGTIALWTMNGSSYTYNSLATSGLAGWSIIDSHGDYNGDGNSDILWRNTDGTIASWTMNGGSIVHKNLALNVDASWSIVDGHGDYNGDGRSDVLWRNTDGTIATWTMSGTTYAYNTLASNLSASWSIVDGHGDYNGDGKSDILWRNTDGTIATWLMNGSSYTYSTLAANVPASWSIIDGHSDYNGDGKSDILWRNTDGTIATWTLNGSSYTYSSLATNVPASWSTIDSAEKGAMINGDAGNSAVTGTVERDTFDVNAGNDTLTGGAGADRFLFDTPLNATTNVDTLTDFTSGSDKLLLSEVIFAGPALGPLAVGNFVAEPGAVAHDANDFILYNTTTGAVSYDADGSGAQSAVVFAMLANHPLLAAQDIQIGLL